MHAHTCHMYTHSHKPWIHPQTCIDVQNVHLHSAHMYTCTHVPTRMLTHMPHVHIHTHHTSTTHTYMQTICTHLHTHVHTCTDTRLYTCTHVQAKTYNIHSYMHRYLFWVPTLYKIYTFTTDHRLEVHRKNSLCIHALIKHLLSTYYVPHFEEYSLKYVS